MERLMPYLGMSAAVIVAVMLILFSGDVTLVRTVEIPNASSTLSVVSPITAPDITLPSLTATATVTLAVAPPPAKSTPIAPVAATPPKTTSASPVTTAPLASDIPAELNASASALRSALVNIICYAPSGSGLTSISGSGVVVDPKGIILTNAHVAQYFLFSDRDVSCTIRTGSPAVDSYKAGLIFISPAWISANASVLTQSNPTGTGEHDFAFLGVTKSATYNSLPASFPFVPLATNPPTAGAPIVIGSYGAQFLESSLIQSSLFPTLVYGSIKDVYTFAVNTIDVLALGGSAAAQEGSSGGGVMTADGKLSGTITTSTVEGATNTRQLDAITASYIRAEYASETGKPLDALLSESLATSVADFAPQMPALESILTANLP